MPNGAVGCTASGVCKMPNRAGAPTVSGACAKASRARCASRGPLGVTSSLGLTGSLHVKRSLCVTGSLQVKLSLGVGSASLALALAMASATAASPSIGAESVPVAAYTVVGDAIPLPLTATRGDAGRGRAIVANRQVGLCLLCHTGPFADERFQGNLAPDLAGAGKRWNAGQLRLRLVDGRRLNPQTIMPAYYRTDGLVRVGRAWQGKPVLSAQQIEDVVAFLQTLRD
jgi:sulfur-oxidizing protein SoxX